MKLRNLSLSLYGYPRDVSVPFSFETRCLCNFVQRPARKLAIATDGFNHIVVRGDPGPNSVIRQVHEKSLIVPFVPDLRRYEAATGAAKQEYFIELLSDGLRRCADQHPLPLAKLLHVIDDFRNGDYKNVWTHQSKLLRRHGLRATLRCELTMDAFDLTLSVSRKEELLLEQSILSTKPDETCFYYRFKDVLIRDDDLVVTTRRGTAGDLFRVPMSSFSE